MFKPDPVPAATLQATASTETMTNDWQEVTPTANEMGCTMGPVTVMTVPPVAGEFAGPSIEYEVEG
jgi:hypothetical protein